MERGGGVVTPMTISSFIKNNWSFKVFSGETSVALIAVETLDRARSFVRRIRPTFDASFAYVRVQPSSSNWKIEKPSLLT